MSEPKPEELPLVRVDGEIIEPPTTSATPAQAKVDAIAALTMQAYAKASELKLTPEEDAALAADFPDEAFRPGASGDQQLIYIEHAFLRDRLNDVIGRGAWAIVVRSKWTEAYKTSTGKDAVHVYSEVMLMVRGCFVAEAVGEMDYYPNNPKTTYADAIEGSKTAAFRRLAKDFGIGLQAWKKGWCEGWWQRRNQPRQQPAKAGTNGQVETWKKLCAEAAMNGTDAYKAAWQAIGKEGRVAMAEFHDGWKTEAASNDGDAKE